MNKNFKRKVEERLDALNMTQRRLAEKLGVNAVTVSRWLNGERDPSVETLDKMARVLETSPSFLLSEDDAQQNAQAQTPQGEKKGGGAGLVVTFGVILGLVIAAVAAGILSKDEKEQLIDELEKGGESPQGGT